MRAHQLAEPIDEAFLDQLAVDWVLCHRFVCDETGGVDGLDYWNGNGGKHLCFDRCRDGYRTFAIGDALNDVSMIRRADDGVLFRPSMETRRAAPDLDTAVTYREVLDRIEGLRTGEGKSAA